MVIKLYLWYIQNGAPKLLLMAQPLKHTPSPSLAGETRVGPEDWLKVIRTSVIYAAVTCVMRWSKTAERMLSCRQAAGVSGGNPRSARLSDWRRRLASSSLYNQYHSPSQFCLWFGRTLLERENSAIADKPRDAFAQTSGVDLSSNMGFTVSQVKPSNCFRLHPTSTISKHSTIQRSREPVGASKKITFTLHFDVKSFIRDDVKLAELAYSTTVLNERMWLLFFFFFWGGGVVKTYSYTSYIQGSRPPTPRMYAHCANNFCPHDHKMNIWSNTVV